MRIAALLVFPFAAAVVCLFQKRVSRIFSWMIFGAAAELVMVAPVSMRVFASGTVTALSGQMFLDALSAFHLCIVTVVFALSSVYAKTYFQNEPEESRLDVRSARKFGALWFSFLGSMVGVLVFNNVGLVWFALEATTLASTFLVCIHSDRLSVEAAWKYLIISSTGIMIGLLGIVFLYGASGGSGDDALRWTSLMESASRMDPRMVKIGFLLILVGYGTKAGLAPMHTWLPDAHSQAPTPVSAVFSGVLLNCAMYCISRFMPVVHIATGGTAWVQQMMLGFGITSMAVAAVFIPIQHDLKRLLAYSSVEHIGIIAIGLGLGPAGAWAGLYHTLNHSIGKTLGFFCAGRLGQIFGSRDMDRITRSIRHSPMWGIGLWTSFLALIGCAPLSIFLSEFLIVRASILQDRIWISVAFIAAATVVFAGALRHAVNMAFGGEDSPRELSPVADRRTAAFLVAGMSVILLVLGVWIPCKLQSVLDAASRIIWPG